MRVNALVYGEAAHLLCFLEFLQLYNCILTQFFISNQVHDKMGLYTEAVRCLPLRDAALANES